MCLYVIKQEKINGLSVRFDEAQTTPVAIMQYIPSIIYKSHNIGMSIYRLAFIIIIYIHKLFGSNN